jgi:aminopeptidase-like protein
MANNEVSGPIITSYLAKVIQQSRPNFSYRFLFMPETIGALFYIKKHRYKLKFRTLSGFIMTCLGDERTYSYLRSKNLNTLGDEIAEYLIETRQINPVKKYDWLSRGSDERQFSSPGIELPIVSIIKSKYGEYPEYHTSLDTMGEVVTYNGLQDSLNLYLKIFSIFENFNFPKAKFIGEPFMSKRNLYPTKSIKGNQSKILRNLMNILSYSDGKTSSLSIARKCNISYEEYLEAQEILTKENLIKLRSKPKLSIFPWR